MPKEQIIKVEGLKELQETLKELPGSLPSTVIRKALARAGEPIERAAATMAPKLTGALQRSIRVASKLSRRQRAIYRQQSEYELFVGAGALVQAITQEFGTIENRAQPFMRPAWEANWRKSLEIFRAALAEEIEKARVKMARKAARFEK